MFFSFFYNVYADNKNTLPQ